MGWEDRITQKLPFTLCLPAVGQGALGIEARSDDRGVQDLVAPINHPDTWAAIIAERAFLRDLQGGCQAPIGAYAQCKDSSLHLEGMVASLDGATLIRLQAEQDRPADPEALGVRLAAEIKEQGGQAILSRIKE
jgi:hydroxymethylbilane synthase